MTKNNSTEDPPGWFTALLVGVLTPPILIAASLLGIYFAFSWAFVIHKLWLWFAVPEGLPELSIPTAGAIWIFRAILLHKSTDAETDGEKLFGKAIAESFRPWSFLLYGWLLTLVF